jgi:hypothetical protein
MDAAGATFLLEKTQRFLKIVREIIENKYAETFALLDEVKDILSQPPSDVIVEHASIIMQRVGICKIAIQKLQQMEFELVENESRYLQIING